MKTKRTYFKPLIIILVCIFIVNIMVEFVIIFTPVDNVSRIGILIIYFENWNQRNYTNTISVTPDELVGTWVIENSNGYYLPEPTKKVKLTLHTDQTFEIVYPANDHRSPPNFSRKSAKQNSTINGMIHFRGQWGIRVYAGKYSFFESDCMEVVGKSEGEEDYVSLGLILDRHVSSPQDRLAIKWWRDSREFGPDKGIYLKKVL